MLVKAGARVESNDKWVKSDTSSELRWIIFHIYWQIVLFAPRISNRDGLTALHCAASRGHTECISVLINLCGAPTDLIDSNGCTALHYAVTLGHADATYILLDLGADPNRQDRKGRTPAHCGCAKGQFETVRKTIEWLRVCARRNSNKFSVRLVRRSKCYGIVKRICGCAMLKVTCHCTRRPHPDDVSSFSGYSISDRNMWTQRATMDERFCILLPAMTTPTCAKYVNFHANRFQINSISIRSRTYQNNTLVCNSQQMLLIVWIFVRSHTNWCRLRGPFSLDSVSVCDSHRQHPLFHVTNGFVCCFFFLLKANLCFTRNGVARFNIAYDATNA